VERAHELRDVLRRVLEVAVHGHDRAAAGPHEPGVHRRVLAEVALQPHRAQARVGVVQLAEPCEGGVGGPVVDEDRLPVVPVERARDAPVQLVDGPRFVPYRHDDRDLHLTDTSGVAVPRRLPTLAAFVTLGLFWGAWAAVLPSVQEATGTSKATLGVAMLFVALGALPAMLFVAGPAVDRFGVRAVAVGCSVLAAATTLPGLASSLLSLVLALTVTGAASGALDVGINANVSRIESATGRRLMPLAHALYSAGILVGAVAAGLARSEGAGRESILLGVAAAIGVTALLLAQDPAQLETPRARRLPSFERALLTIGVLGAAAFVVEGGTESWSALFLERQLHAQPDVSGLGPGFFG